ncbi:MAG: polyhydroxyalkanoate synthesis regulator DNA-binding domain-containing protein [Pseudomonadota bacterium]
MREFKKYPNRRLYDLRESRYVTLEGIREAIMAGESIRVTDSKDDADITRLILLQIISEQETKGRGAILTNRVMEHLIRLYDDAFGAIASRYIEQSVLTFLDYQAQAQTQLRRMQNLNPFANAQSNPAFEAMKKAFESAWPGGMGARGADGERSSPSTSSDDPGAADEPADQRKS